VPRKNLGEPLTAALRTASRCSSRLTTGQAVSVGAKAALEQRVAVEMEMLRRDRRGDVRGCIGDELGRLAWW
jgi:hypothetical protein